MDAPSTTAELLARLVSFDTTSRNSNLALISFVRDYLDALGAAKPVIAQADLDAAVAEAIEPFSREPKVPLTVASSTV